MIDAENHRTALFFDLFLDMIWTPPQISRGPYACCQRSPTRHTMPNRFEKNLDLGDILEFWDPNQHFGERLTRISTKFCMRSTAKGCQGWLRPQVPFLVPEWFSRFIPPLWMRLHAFPNVFKPPNISRKEIWNFRNSGFFHVFSQKDTLKCFPRV